jgi:hypothetical protein
MKIEIPNDLRQPAKMLLAEVTGKVDGYKARVAARAAERSATDARIGELTQRIDKLKKSAATSDDDGAKLIVAERQLVILQEQLANLDGSAAVPLPELAEGAGVLGAVQLAAQRAFEAELKRVCAEFGASGNDLGMIRTEACSASAAFSYSTKLDDYNTRLILGWLRNAVEGNSNLSAGL